MSVRKSLALSFLDHYGQLLLSIAPVLVLARLLTPAEIGIFSVSVAFIGIAHMLREFGIMTFLIQEKELTEQKIRTAFTVALAIGSTFGMVLLAARIPLAWFYDEPGMSNVIAVVSLNFFLIPFGMPVQALLQREMRFDALLRMNFGGTFVGVVTTLALAFLGFSYMSMAWGSLAGVVATVMIAFMIRPDAVAYRPSLRGWRSVLSFGTKSSMASMVSEMGNRMPELASGRLLGFDAAGLYSRANSLIELFNQTIISAIWPVALPAFAERHRAGASMAAAYLETISNLSAIAWPFFGFLGLLAYPVIRVFFGDQWDEAVPAAQILCVSSLLLVPTMLANNVMLAMGRPGRVLALALIVNGISIPLIIIAASHSIEAIAGVRAVFALVSLAAAHYLLRPLIGVGVGAIFRATSRSAGVFVGSMIGPAAVVALVDTTADPWLGLGLAAALSAIGWVAAIFWLDHSLKREALRMISFLRAPVIEYLNGKGVFRRKG